MVRIHTEASGLSEYVGRVFRTSLSERELAGPMFALLLHSRCHQEWNDGPV